MSTVPDAKAAILAALRAHPDLQGAQVEWAHPGAAIKLEAIYFGDTEHQQNYVAMPRGRREEYVLNLVVTVEDRGNNAERAERRCWAILDTIADAIAEDFTLGELVDVAQFSAAPVQCYFGAGKRVAESVVRISATADV